MILKVVNRNNKTLGKWLLTSQHVQKASKCKASSTKRDSGKEAETKNGCAKEFRRLTLHETQKEVVNDARNWGS